MGFYTKISNKHGIYSYEYHNYLTSFFLNYKKGVRKWGARDIELPPVARTAEALVPRGL